MTISKLSCPMRLVFVMMAVLIWVGILLTGFGNVHWFMYIPAIGATVAAVTGLCMGDTLMGKFCK